MEIVFNDYSLSEQFSTAEDFVDSLRNHTLPLLDILRRCDSIILKKYQTYELNVTSDITLYDFLKSPQLKGYAESQKLRSLLAALTDNPYWEDSPKTQCGSLYETEYTGPFAGDMPNCFSEAFERDNTLLSFENDDFKNFKISISKDGNEGYINNFYNTDSSLEVLFQKRYLCFSELLYNLRERVDIDFFKQNEEVYIDKEFDDERLSYEDVYKIADYFKKWIFGIKTGDMLAHLTDSISYKSVSYNEFRVSLADNREFRIFYKLFGSKYVFFNLLLKDTPTTPEHIKLKTYGLIKKYTNV